MAADDVAAAWAQDMPSHAGNLLTDGQRLMSYALEIGFTAADGTKVLRDYRSGSGYGYESRTTSGHVTAAETHADVLLSSPEEEEQRGFGRDTFEVSVETYERLNSGDATALRGQYLAGFDLEALFKCWFLYGSRSKQAGG